MKPGDIVQIKADVLPRLPASTKRTVEGRAGRVGSVYTPLGSRTEMATVFWKHRRGTKESRYADYWPARDLEIVKEAA
jgi:hypothetical protein